MRSRDTKHVGASSQVPADEALAARVDIALRALPQLAPAPDFQVRVLAQLRIRKFAWVRLRAWLTGSSCGVPDPFGALLEGGISRRQARALAAFVAVDPEAAAAWPTASGWPRGSRAFPRWGRDSASRTESWPAFP